MEANHFMICIMLSILFCTFQCSTINDAGDYKNVMNAMKTLGFAFRHAETLWKIVAAVIVLVSSIDESTL